MNAFVPVNFGDHFLQSSQVTIVLEELIVRYLLVVFQLSNVDTFTDIADSVVTQLAHSTAFFIHFSQVVCVYC